MLVRVLYIVEYIAVNLSAKFLWHCKAVWLQHSSTRCPFHKQWWMSNETILRVENLWQNDWMLLKPQSEHLTFESDDSLAVKIGRFGVCMVCLLA